MKKDNWQLYYDLVLNYYNKYGNALIKYNFKTLDGINYHEDGLYIGKWLNKQFSSTLSDERKDKLLKIGVNTKESYKDYKWNTLYKMILYYNSLNNDLDLDPNFKTLDGVNYHKDGYTLYNWLSYQLKFSSLTEKQIELLNDIGINIYDKKCNISWLKHYKLLLTYYNFYKKFPEHYFKTKDGINYDEDGFALGKWLKQQETIEDKLSKEKKELLKKCNIVFRNSRKNFTWDESYEIARTYYNTYGNLDVKKYFTTFDGISFNKDGHNLYNWLKSNKANKNISTERKNKLISIGFSFEPVVVKYNYEWDNNYNLAVNFYNKFGNLEVPRGFKTLDGTTYNESGYNLYNWIINQRKRKNKLTEKQVESLSKIGMRFELKNNIIWEKNYQLLLSYYNHYKNLNIPDNFKTLNGVDYDTEGINLARWLTSQRNNHSLSYIQKEKLQKLNIEVDMNKNGEKWQTNYKLASKYFNTYNNLRITPNFTTKDGITESKYGFNLGRWITTQRLNKNISIDRIIKLNSIGMIWNVRKNIKELKKLLSLYNIDINVNKDILNKSYIEVYSKIMYLLDNNINLTDNKGKLISIFYISNHNLQEQYNINIEDILNKYTKNRLRKKI